MYVVQIKGCNGAGKSTIPKQMVEQSANVEFDGVNTVLHDVGWVLIGPYEPGKLTACGCDKLSKVQAVKDAILNALDNHSTYHILFEGMMISTIKSTFYDFLMDLRQSRGIDPLFVILKATPEGCLERLSARGTRKESLKVDNIVNKCDLVLRHASTYPPEYVRYIDVESTPLDGMLGALLDMVANPYLPASVFRYEDLIGMTSDDVVSRLVGLGHESVAYSAKLDAGQKKRFLGSVLLLALEHCRDDCPEPEVGAPYTFEPSGTVDNYGRVVGYKTSTGNVMDLVVNVHRLARYEIPLMTPWEQVSLCGACGGSRGCCPGFAPRFTDIRPKAGVVYVVTVSMDLSWALLYGSHRNIYMPLTYTDMITMSYIRRLLKAIQGSGRYVLGAGSCPGKCRPCTVLRGEACSKPSLRQYSVEATGVDCDELHYYLYREYLPWAYKGHWVVPKYMTRYAIVVPSSSYDNIGEALDEAMRDDVAYVEISNVPVKLPEIEMMKWQIPSGVHKGCHQYIYRMDRS